MQCGLDILLSCYLKEHTLRTFLNIATLLSTGTYQGDPRTYALICPYLIPSSNPRIHKVHTDAPLGERMGTRELACVPRARAGTPSRFIIPD